MEDGDFLCRFLLILAVLHLERDGVCTIGGEDEFGVFVGGGFGHSARHAPFVFGTFGREVGQLYGLVVEGHQFVFVHVKPSADAEVGCGAQDAAGFAYHHVVHGHIACLRALGGEVHGEAVLARHHRREGNGLQRPLRERLVLNAQQLRSMGSGFLFLTNGHGHIGVVHTRGRARTGHIEVEGHDVFLASLHIEERRIGALVARYVAVGRNHVISTTVSQQFVDIGRHEGHVTRRGPSCGQLATAIVVFVFVVEGLLVGHFLGGMLDGFLVLFQVVKRARCDFCRCGGSSDARHLEFLGGCFFIEQGTVGKDAERGRIARFVGQGVFHIFLKHVACFHILQAHAVKGNEFSEVRSGRSGQFGNGHGRGGQGHTALRGRNGLGVERQRGGTVLHGNGAGHILHFITSGKADACGQHKGSTGRSILEVGRVRGSVKMANEGFTLEGVFGLGVKAGCEHLAEGVELACQYGRGAFAFHDYIVNGQRTARCHFGHNLEGEIISARGLGGKGEGILRPVGVRLTGRDAQLNGLGLGRLGCASRHLYLIVAHRGGTTATAYHPEGDGAGLAALELEARRIDGAVRKVGTRCRSTHDIGTRMTGQA